jgi:DNA-directed RNA polymerase subunit L
MSYVSNVVLNNDQISFEINNKSQDLKISFVNALRRILISDIYVWNIDNINFFINNSLFDDQLLKKRLVLIPIISNNANIEYDNITFTCEKINNEETIEDIYVKDFKCKYNNEEIEMDKLIKKEYFEILIGKLKNNQQISFEAKLVYSNANNKGSAYSPVSACTYKFKVDDKEASNISKNMNDEEKRQFNTQNIEKVYERNSIGEPLTYQFSYESIGYYENVYLFHDTINILKMKLLNIKEEITNKKSTKINIIENYENPDFYQFLMKDENDTLGNLLSTYINNDENVFYSGYLIEHPLKNEIILKIKLKDNNTIENVIETIIKHIDNLIKISDKVLIDFDKNID